MIEEIKEKKEIDWLRYKGNTIPVLIRFVWFILILFCIYYLSKYAWPDLKMWLDHADPR